MDNLISSLQLCHEVLYVEIQQLRELYRRMQNHRAKNEDDAAFVMLVNHTMLMLVAQSQHPLLQSLNPLEQLSHLRTHIALHRHTGTHLHD